MSCLLIALNPKKVLPVVTVASYNPLGHKEVSLGGHLWGAKEEEEESAVLGVRDTV